MSITVNEVNGYTVITVEAERLDVVNMNEMKESMMDVVDNGHHKVVIDLSKVTFVDSSGLSVIISLFKRLNALKGELILCGLGEQPKELLEITQLIRLFKVTDTCEEAVRS
jgi:anti-sigma B factor antagonist